MRSKSGRQKKLTRTKVSVYFKDPNATRFGPVDGDDNALKDNWECVICGASNRSGSGKCTMCGVKEQLKSKAKPKGITEPSAMHGWVCTSCTLINPPANERCEACERPRLPSRHKIEGAGGGAQARYVRLSLRFDSGGTGAFVEYMRKMIFALKSASSRKGDDKERDDSGPPALGIRECATSALLRANPHCVRSQCC